jgi:hypothetical protein
MEKVKTQVGFKNVCVRELAKLFAFVLDEQGMTEVEAHYLIKDAFRHLHERDMEAIEERMARLYSIVDQIPLEKQRTSKEGLKATKDR